MPKSKFKIDPHSLEFVKVRVTWRERFKKISISFVSMVIFSGIVLAVSYNLFPSPKELALKRENKQLQLQYELLTDKINKLSTVLSDLEDRDDNIYRTIFEAEPISKEKRMAGVGGSDRYENLEGYQSSKTVVEATQKIDQLSRRLYIQSKSYDEVYNMAKNKLSMMASLPAIQPISNKNLKSIASGFGYRIHPVYKSWIMHTGIDFTAPVGTPIYATGDGIVENLRAGMSGYGNVIMINHGFGYETLYAHCSKIIAKPGQRVKRGEIIAYVGNTGMSTGPHVHYEVRKGRVPINPINFFYQDLTPEEYEKVLEISSRANQSMS